MVNDNVKIPSQRWWHILPPCVLIYIVAFIDRTNIGLAIAGGMDKTLGLSASIAGLASGIFFIGYMILQIPGGNIAEHGDAKKFISFSIVAWGVLSILNGLVNNTWELLTIRFLLGVAEGGVYPAILVIITHWFPNEERARANGYFAMNFAIANIIASPFSGWIMSISNWRWVFIIEGIIPFALLLIWYPLISNFPEEAKWISKEELNWIKDELAKENELVEKTASNDDNKIGSIFKTSKLWLLTFTYFFFQIGIYGFYLWLPTLIKELTKTGIGVVGLLSAVPYIGSMIGIWLFSALSDKTQKRKLFTVLPMLLFALSLLLSVAFKSNIWVSYAFLVLCGFFVQSYNSSFWAVPPMIFKSDVAGAARGFINALGNLGGFVGPYLMGLLASYFNTNVGIYILAISLVIGSITELIIKLPAENKSVI
ncbi:MFS transporter [Thermoanaerobacterium thermosaccharolyticum]|uniref:MFS transporter n=1 Tax=Thermoanaerobacterium thermosaccharolyticum TaxID=1517 RepID=UPI003D2B39B1